MKRAIALGAFDGLHLAHMAVLRAAAAQPGCRAAVLLFPEHPEKLLAGQAPPRLLDDAQRDDILRGMGLELLFVPFDEIVQMPPEDFFCDILAGRFRAGALCCGYHYRFGRGGVGSAARLREMCDRSGIGLTIIPEMDYQGEPISSTRIREALARGRLSEANAMLGRAFGYVLPVVEGDRLGRTLGAPTLNQIFAPGFCVPRHGVYASEAFVEGRWQAAVSNIGQRPSFAASQLRSETHILGFEGDLYGQTVPVRLLRYLREERKFGSMEELKGQIALDKRMALPGGQ
ncbi:MAG: riboflavin biosynthesis protein RibF [Oscillospiraceae bacterium]|nr:riboflavin biosynthesis protein RibF [Oscillospiraceae bacterium]